MACVCVYKYTYVACVDRCECVCACVHFGHIHTSEAAVASLPRDLSLCRASSEAVVVARSICLSDTPTQREDLVLAFFDLLDVSKFHVHLHHLYVCVFT